MMSIFYLSLLVTFLLYTCSQGSDSVNTSNNQSKALDQNLFSQPMTGFQDFDSAPLITSSLRTSKPDSYLLSWEPNSKVSSIQSFKIRFKKISDNVWTYNTISGNKSELLLTSLDSSSVYEVQMIRLSKLNNPSQLAMSSFRTGAVKKKSSNSTSSLPTLVLPSHNEKSWNTTGQIPGAPSMPHVVITSPTSVSLTWLPRSNGGSPITGYKVQVRLMGGKRNKWKTETKLPADIKTVNVEDLKRDSSYKFRIIAINALGESDPSASAIKRPKSDPRARLNLKIAPDVTVELLANGSVLIRWTYEITQPNSVDGYIVKYFVAGKHKRKKIRDPNVLSYEIANPIHTEQYSVRVQSFKANEQSPESYPIKFKVMRDHAMKKDVLKTYGLYKAISETVPSGGGISGNVPIVPPHNNKVKTTSSQRDIAIIIAGSVLALVIFVLLVSCKIFHMQKKRNKSSDHVGSDAAQNEPSDLCAKLFGSLYSQPKSSPPTNRSPVPPSSPYQCSCYSGTSSPVRTGPSCLQSNRTSMSHSAMPENGLVAYPRVSGNPLYTVYYDYSSNRPPPPCVTTSGIPICWIRGEGEFCHIIPHNSRVKAVEEVNQNEAEGDKQEPATSTMATTQSSLSNNTSDIESTEEISPEQVTLLAKSDAEKVVDGT